jgi:hypothetical protein
MLYYYLYFKVFTYFLNKTKIQELFLRKNNNDKYFYMKAYIKRPIIDGLPALLWACGWHTKQCKAHRPTLSTHGLL